MIPTDRLITIAHTGETQPLPPLAPPPASGAPTLPLARAPIDRLLLVIAAGSSALALALALGLVLALGARAEPVAVAATKVAAPTPAIVIALSAAARPPQIVAFWAPDGGVYGTVALEGAITIAAQYRDWAQFRTQYMDAPLWAPIAALNGAVPIDRIAAAPRLAPTPQPIAAPPAIVAVAVPAQAQAAASAPLAQLAPTATTLPLVVLVDEPGRYVAAVPTPPGATAAPVEWGEGGVSGGSWGD